MKRCSLCDNPVKFVDFTAIGERGFCSEKCWAQYVGMPIQSEGYYGKEAEPIMRIETDEYIYEEYDEP
jgi:hypothetical protein|tara:strand:- start:14495 stop:14698 length:204 start_codon:yes stop_codon:yes gene_type:complete